jgi:hypothetical protein
MNELMDDPVAQLLLTGEAQTVDEAEELYLERSWPEFLELLKSPLSDAELERHPIFELLRSRGMRGWEDSIL